MKILNNLHMCMEIHYVHESVLVADAAVKIISKLGASPTLHLTKYQLENPELKLNRWIELSETRRS